MLCASKLRWHFRIIVHGLCNLWAWLPIVWHDASSDQAYLFALLHFKLTRMAKFFEEGACVARADRTARQIRTCVALIQRMQFEDYMQNAQDGEFTKEIWIKHSERMHEQDLEYFCTIFRKHVRTWWD